jgi:hypothetical protein
MNRRTFFLGTTALVATGCTITTNGGVTSLTLNVAKVNAYGQVLVNGVSTVLSFAAIASAIGAPAVVIINLASAALSASLTAWNRASGGSLTVDYNNASVSAAFGTVLTDAATLLSQVKAALGAITGLPTSASAALSTANTALGAMETGLSFLQAMITVGGARVGVVAVPRMSEAEMFAAVGMKAP